jgi:hypothetical protein
MRISRLENFSSEVLDIELVSGGTIKLPSGGILENIDIVNSNGLRYKASIIFDLTEIDESRRSKTSKVRLND